MNGNILSPCMYVCMKGNIHYLPVCMYVCISAVRVILRGKAHAEWKVVLSGDRRTVSTTIYNTIIPSPALYLCMYL